MGDLGGWQARIREVEESWDLASKHPVGGSFVGLLWRGL